MELSSSPEAFIAPIPTSASFIQSLRGPMFGSSPSRPPPSVLRRSERNSALVTIRLSSHRCSWSAVMPEFVHKILSRFICEATAGLQVWKLLSFGDLLIVNHRSSVLWESSFIPDKQEGRTPSKKERHLQNDWRRVERNKIRTSHCSRCRWMLTRGLRACLPEMVTWAFLSVQYDYTTEFVKW